MTLEIIRLMATYFLFDLQLVNDGCQLGQDLVCLLVVFKLGGNKVGEVAERFGCVENLQISVCVSCTA
jgi:hypothetical protein